MSRASAQELVTFLQHELGPQLRSVAYYEENEREILYARDDVTEQYTDEQIEQIFQDLFFETWGRFQQETLYAHGNLNSIVRCFDDAVEMHFPLGELSGVAVAVDPEAVPELYSITDDCLDQLHGNAPSG
ncbi:hypothetical protein C2R22_23265 (plasmid) [Salinigranum rubrum]|uniref:Uncharacterized protein n=1 Tax=Salinigranum rubrum TaxID=755307 RepID=A0A2I8VTG7_9EURY|nr:hypothetical protein [Salinigranum rubrum]AUV84469.1 hypothetical protein C2R22_23265 [Salinigranum rubrum]